MDEAKINAIIVLLMLLAVAITWLCVEVWRVSRVLLPIANSNLVQLASRL